MPGDKKATEARGQEVIREGGKKLPKALTVQPVTCLEA